MKNYYYLIWSDAIQRAKLHHPYDKYWKFRICFHISFLEGVILCMTFIWIDKFNIYYVDPIYVNLCVYDKINKVVSFFIMYILPFFVLNYLLFFLSNHYEKIIKKYPMNETEYMQKFIFFTFYYSIISLAVFSWVGNGRFIGD